jgi:hypothetical protein
LLLIDRFDFDNWAAMHSIRDRFSTTFQYLPIDRPLPVYLDDILVLPSQVHIERGCHIGGSK